MPVSSEDKKHQIKVWSTKAVNQFLEDLENGVERTDSPFYFGDTQLRRPNLLFEYTQEEIQELIKCKNNINYFANNYAYTMNPSTGALKLITLRDYQEDLLNTINDNRYTVIVAARQSGKCSIGSETVELEDGSKKRFVDLYDDGNSGMLANMVSKIKRCLYRLYEKL